MNKILFFLKFGFLGWLILSDSGQCFAQKKAGGQKLPNVLFIVADDLGYGDLKSFNPKAQVLTPNLSKLALNGMRFINAHSASSVCTPSRYAMMTGRYAFRTSMKKGVLGGYSPALIEDDRFTIADLAKAAGYQTAIIGKWHLGLDWKPKDLSKPAIQSRNGQDPDITNIDFGSAVVNGPNTVGFDYSYILPASLDMSPYLYIENGKATGLPLQSFKGQNTGRGVFWREGLAGKNFEIDETLDVFVSQAQQYIKNAQVSSPKPFFLYLPLTAPHTPWLPAQKFKGSSKAGVYGDFVAHTDDAVGRVLATLDQLHLSENTLIIFTSDNGADWKQKDLAEFPLHRANYKFKGEKSDIWDGGHHIPLVISWPGHIAKNSIADDIVCLSDVMRTISAMTHTQLPSAAGRDSYSFWPVLTGAGRTERTSIVHHSNGGMFAIRRGKWKFIDGKGSGGWSVDEHQADFPGQLYDMEADEEETTNLYDKYPEVVTELKQLLEKIKDQP